MTLESSQVALEVFAYILRSLAGDIQSSLSVFEAQRDWSGLIATFPLGVLFGMCTAVMPGHNKAVLAAYAIDDDTTVARAFETSTMLAIFQVGMAILLSFAFTSLVITPAVGEAQAPKLELASRLILLVIGFWLLARVVSQTRRDPDTDYKHAYISAAAGLIPCPFTLVMMMYAVGIDAPQAGIALALAMLVGILAVNCSITITVASFRMLILNWLAHRSVRSGSGSHWTQWLSALLLIAIASLELWF
jgi:nickel/cobalt transporter (NicO) family protein